MTFPQTWHEWFNLAERGVLRLVMIGIGLALMVVGLALGVSMVMLPAGLLLGFTGLGLLVWGTLGDLPIDR
jgi:hypothetical protein